MEYTDSKTFLVNAFDGDDERMFIAWETNSGNIISVEHIYGNYPPITTVIWDDMKEFISGIAWHTWIINGIKNDDLKKRIAEKENEDE